MLEKCRKYWLSIFVLFLLLAVVFIFYLDFHKKPHQLTFAVLDIGQGDALFIQSPTGTQILVDGGPPRKLLSRLSRVMPLFDKKIDAIVITNPDADHIAGFLDLLKVYKVGQVFDSGTFNDSTVYENLENKIKQKNIPRTVVEKGMRLDLGGGAVLDVLFPDQDVSLWKTNEGSIIMKLTYGESSVLLTGDAPISTEQLVLKSTPIEFLDSDILKVGHHGSHTSTSEDFVKAITPAYALISDGKTNKYGHPHQETLNTLESLGVKIFRTDLSGTIIMKSDGFTETFSFKK